MRQLLTLCLLASLIPCTHAQFLTPQPEMSLAPNLVYVEALGVSQTWSLNYEGTFVQGDMVGASTRIGASVFPRKGEELEFDVPVLLNLLVGRGPVVGELGAGTRIHFTEKVVEEMPEFYPAGTVGIRYHPGRNGGFFMKLSYTPSYIDGNINHMGGLGIGFGI